MKAVRIHEHGGPEVLRHEDAEEPRLRPDQVLIKVRACSLNRLDLFVRGGVPGAKLTLPHILGSDAAGEVAELGELCTRIKSGQRVLVAPGFSCRQCEFCVSGQDNFCRRYGLFGYQASGTNAEYIAVPEVNAIPIPGELSFEEAAAVPLVFLTAWHMLTGVAKIKPGEDVLVVGAGSGVGSAAVQIAKMFHCRVITTAGDETKLAKAKDLGADEVIDHYRQTIKDEVRRITAKKGVDVVVEHVGAATWEQSTASLAHHGRLVTCGATTGADVRVNLAHLFFRHLSLLGSVMGTLGELHQVLKLIGRGRLKAVVDRTFPLSELRAAHEHLETGKQFGKVVVTV